MFWISKDKIAVAPIRDPNMIGSLYVPDQAIERPDQGIVKYIGSEVEDIYVGDYVLFSGYTGTYVTLEGEGELIIMKSEFIVGKIQPPGTEITGLYFKDKQGEYFQATYEMAIAFIAKAMQEADWYNEVDAKQNKKFSVKVPKLDASEVTWKS